jgi:translocation and assembly module TamB
MRAAFGADLAASTIDTVVLDTAHIRIAIAGGLARVDSALLKGSGATALVNGTFGLASNAHGELQYSIRVDSLKTLARYLPPADTGSVPPRPRLVAERLAQARRDSAARADSTMVARAATGLPPLPRLQVDTPQAVRRDSLAGSVYAAGTIVGWVHELELRGRLAAQNIIARGSSVRRARMEYSGTRRLAAGPIVAVGADMDSVSAGGFALDSVNVRMAYGSPNGKAAILLVQDSGRTYTAGGDFTLHTGHNELHLRDLALRFDSTTWTAARPGAIRWGATGFEVNQLELTAGEGRRIAVNGRLPSDSGAGKLDLTIDNFEVGDIAALLQSDLPARGLVSLRTTIEGPTRAPLMRGAAGLVGGTWGGKPLADARLAFNYANERLDARLEAERSGRVPFAVATARVPINLALGTKAPRFPSGGLEVNIDADSLPLGLVPTFTSLVSDMSGLAVGSIRIRGTTKRPALVGAVGLTGGSVRFEPTGVFYHDVSAAIRMMRDTIVIDSIAGYAGGRIFVRGGLGIAKLTSPSFDVRLQADNARVLDNERGSVRASANVALRGPFDNARANGNVSVRSGVLYIPESNHKRVIGAGDPALVAVIDTALAGQAGLLVTESPLMANLQINVAANVQRDTWVRSRDANIEVFTPPGEDLRIRMNRRTGAIALEGALTTDRGEYTFLSKRFQVRQGTATFIGTAEPDPSLQITGEYEVRTPEREALAIRVLIGGTATQPRISLESDAQPPIPQSDLLSYLAFGRSSSSLLQLEGSSLSGSGGGTTVGGLAGASASLLGQRLAAVALDAFVEDFEGQATRQTGADVFNITPADISSETRNRGATGFLQGTQIEVGKYTDPRTFFALQTRLSMFASRREDRASPGFRIQRRTGKGFRVEASFEPRYLLKAPTLEINQRIAGTAVFGAFHIREWRF